MKRSLRASKVRLTRKITHPSVFNLTSLVLPAYRGRLYFLRIFSKLTTKVASQSKILNDGFQKFKKVEINDRIKYPASNFKTPRENFFNQNFASISGLIVKMTQKTRNPDLLVAKITFSMNLQDFEVNFSSSLMANIHMAISTVINLFGSLHSTGQYNQKLLMSF